MDSITYKFTSFRPTFAGTSFMNDMSVQRELLRRAKRATAAVKKKGYDAKCDVRAGQRRAHARVTAFADENTSQQAESLPNALMASLDAARY